MTVYRFSNFAASTLQLAVSASATALVIGAADAANFPTLAGGEAFYLTLWDRVNAPEIVQVNSISGQNLTVARGQDGTAARAWAAGTVVRVSVTKGLIESLRASTLTTNISGATNGQALFYNGTQWYNKNIAESDVTNLVADLAAINTTLSTHTHTAAQVAGGNPQFTTVSAVQPTALANGFDLNTLDAVGIWSVSNPTNGPGAGNWVIQGMRYSASAQVQIATELTGAATLQSIRRKIGAIWSSWVTLPTTTSEAASIVAAQVALVPTVAGTGDAQTWDFVPDVSLRDGLRVCAKAPGTSTSTTPTAAADGGSALTIVGRDGNALLAGAIVSGYPHTYEYKATGTKWVLIDPAPASVVGMLAGANNQSPLTALTAASVWAYGAVIASAASITIGDYGYATISGTTTITSIAFSTSKQGRRVLLRAGNNFKITHNSSTLICAHGSDYNARTGDLFYVIDEGGGAVRVQGLTRQGRVEKTADQSIVSSAALADDTELKFPIEANKKYRGRVLVYFNVGAGNGVISLNGPTAPTKVRYGFEGGAFNSTIYDSTVFTATATTGTRVLVFYIENGANAGTLAVRLAQSTSNVAASTFEKGSFIDYEEVP